MYSYIAQYLTSTAFIVYFYTVYLLILSTYISTSMSLYRAITQYPCSSILLYCLYPYSYVLTASTLQYTSMHLVISVTLPILIYSATCIHLLLYQYLTVIAVYVLYISYLQSYSVYIEINIDLIESSMTSNYRQCSQLYSLMLLPDEPLTSSISQHIHVASNIELSYSSCSWPLILYLTTDRIKIDSPIASYSVYIPLYSFIQLTRQYVVI